ncbi:MAG: NADH-quinone oxidoreductase subunit NuoH [Chlorobiaceae bacterium]|nr:NADH-quinone oxidoreductase subunit NuoH [Chlorobiaceae bacterium]MBA4310717.1 NADH-quinone oxidoreductase subunit NuoH [Chlorobiaceae bacterium]
MIFEFFADLLGSQILSAIIIAALPLVFIILYVLLANWLERKVSAHMQDRLGPMRVGWHGWLQPIADMIKILQKEDIVAKDADRKLFSAAPVLVFVGCYAAFAAIPFSSAFVGADLELGLLYILAVSSIVVAGILMAGWASNNKYALIGAVRSAAQIISYEIPTVFIILCIIIVSGTLNLTTLSEQQSGTFLNWYILGGDVEGWKKFALIPFMFIGFIVMYISSVAESNRTPFDLPEAESELVAGYHTEYSGMKFAMYLFAEYANMFVVSALVVAMFLGGYQSPFGYVGDLINVPWLIPIEQFFWFTVKGLFFVFVQMWLRWTLPRLRVDQLMALCWKYLIPIAFVNLLIISFLMIL